MSRGVDQVERILLPVAGGVFHLYRVALDRNALFAFEIHVVEHLRLHFALIQGVGFFEQAVCQRALAVVDVGYDAEVADVFHKSHKNVCKYTKYFGFTEGAVALGPQMRRSGIFPIFAVSNTVSAHECRFEIRFAR